MIACPTRGQRFEAMPDEEIVDLARHGHGDAAEYLVAQYSAVVELKARPYFLAGADREDVIQEGMIGLCKAIRDYRTDRLERFRPFAEICVTRQIISAVKSATRHKHTVLSNCVSLQQPLSDDPSDGSLLDTLADPGAESPLGALLDKQTPDALHSAMAGAMSPMERGVLQRYLNGMSYSEIGQELHVAPKSIDNALQRIKKKLADAMEI